MSYLLQFTMLLQNKLNLSTAGRQNLGFKKNESIELSSNAYSG